MAVRVEMGPCWEPCLGPLTVLKWLAGVLAPPCLSDKVLESASKSALPFAARFSGVVWITSVPFVFLRNALLDSFARFNAGAPLLNQCPCRRTNFLECSVLVNVKCIDAFHAGEYSRFHNYEGIANSLIPIAKVVSLVIGKSWIRAVTSRIKFALTQIGCRKRDSLDGSTLIRKENASFCPRLNRSASHIS